MRVRGASWAVLVALGAGSAACPAFLSAPFRIDPDAGTSDATARTQLPAIKAERAIARLPVRRSK